MSLAPSTRLGPYEVVSAIGAGGMGEVYRAHDTKLNRDVAIKVLPATFAQDHERVARFKREAQVLASLNHPNIAAIHGLEEADPSALQPGSGQGSGGQAAIIALVMELVEGEDLSAHIARGPMPLPEVLPIARQIAEALEAAHEQGIVHRDLKPGNIKVRDDGTVKVLDFGLAKAMDPSGASNPDVSHSPTLTHQGTQAGMIIGTAAYMSPEQAKGKTVDKRADIWAFGVVLYEMLTGKRAFKGEDVSETLASVLKDTLSMDALPASTPPRLKRLIERCLERDLKNRLRDIGEARFEISKIESGAPYEAVAPAAATGAMLPRWRRTLPWGAKAWPWATLAAVLGAGLVVALWLRAPWTSTPAPGSRRLLVGIGADAYIVTNDDSQGSAVVVSPDGKTMAFIGARKVPGSRAQLFVRTLDQLQATPLDGTDGAFAPFFSPDSQWIAFFVGTAGAEGMLKKIKVTGGATFSICTAFMGRGGWWTEDDTIIFSQLRKPSTTLMRVSAAGGTPVPFGAFGEGATNQRWPQVLPGGASVLYTEHSSGNRFDFANLVVAAAKAGGAPKVVARGGSYGRYVAMGTSGYLTYVRQQTLMAMPFDLSRLEPTGPAVPVVEDVSLAGVGGSASVAVSPDGTLVYLPDTNTEPARAIHWLSHEGKTSVLRATETHWTEPRLSPDGRQLALIETDKQQRIFVLDLTRDIPKQVTAQGGASSPVWTPDGKRMAFASDPGRGVSNLWLTNADGSGSPTRLTTSPNDQQPYSWDPTGKFLAYAEIQQNTARDVMILKVEDDAGREWKAGTPILFKGTVANELDPAFSPDGRWVAYLSNESGATEVYVSPFPGPGGAVPVSAGGGSHPRWSATSHELLFWNKGKIISVPYTTADTFVPGSPRLWAPQDGIVGPDFDIHPDGKRLVIGRDDAEARQAAVYARDKIVFWSGFFDYLRKNVVTKR